MKPNLILILIIIMFVILFMLNNNSIFENMQNDPCGNNLTDLEYLHHMIPHHQVAVDISILLQKKTKNPVMQEILRKLIWVQNYEISLMEEMLTSLPENDMSSLDKMNMIYISTIGDFTKPNKLGLTKTYCDPHFFNPEEHMKHLQHMELTDKMYLEHMIPHHQVAVDMSKKLLKNTENDFMIYLAYRIIRSQQEEIVLLNHLLNKDNYNYQSNLVL